MFHDPGTRSLTRHKHMTQSCNLFHYYLLSTQHPKPNLLRSWWRWWSFRRQSERNFHFLLHLLGQWWCRLLIKSINMKTWLCGGIPWLERVQIAPSGNDRLMNGGASAKTIQWPQSTSESCTFIGKFLGKIVRLSQGISFLSMLVTFINYYYYS